MSEIDGRLSSDERQWLHALVRGPLSRTAADRSMPAATRASLLEKGFIVWVGSSLTLSARGREQVERLREGAPADAAKTESTASNAKPAELTDSQAAWLQNVLDRRFRGEFAGRIPQAKTLRAQAHLRHGFLAGDVDRAMSGASERRGGLDEQSRFTDARIATNKQDRAAHEAAASNPIQLGDPAGQTRSVVSLTGERFEGKETPFASLAVQPRSPFRTFLA